MTESAPTTPGSHDGAGAGDHDTPYTWGHHLTTDDSFPFTPLAYSRLLVFRSKVREGLTCQDDLVGDPLPPELAS